MSRFKVIRPDQTSQPFMRGILTNELMHRGMSFQKAFQIAEDTKLHFQNEKEIKSKLLWKIIEELIKKRFGKKELDSLLPENMKPGDIRVVQGQSSVPFSKVLLTQSMTAAGLDLNQAFRISQEFEQHLLFEKTQQIEKAAIFQQIRKIIEKQFDPYTADLYQMASRLDQLKRPVIIYIGGAPGTGKSVLATSLATRLGINKVISTDSIREIMRLAFSSDLLPTLFHSTTEAWKGLPMEFQSSEQLIAGYCLQANQVSLGVRAVVERTVEEGQNLIIEGTHLVTFLHEVAKKNIVDANHIPISLSIMNEKYHRERFSERGSSNLRKIENYYLKRFYEIRKIHEYTLTQCEADEVEVFDNEDFDKTLNLMIQFSIQTLLKQVNSE
uniref:2-phosphoglycerate kinase n=1 Tax=uncultured delta proteobacterium HF0200_39L23 TaxID=710832 RepID=E0XXW2_9DELT|nr:2-phosphoglycerate kinase [uncultured delta proteobacterium HF0200_39L23]